MNRPTATMHRAHHGAALLAVVALLAALLPGAVAQPIDTTTKESLRAQVNAITNWDQFKAGNNLSGWDFDTATTKAGFVHYCNWTGIECVNLAVTTLELPCDDLSGTGYCAVRAEGALAPELANISSLVGLDFSGQQLAGALPESYGSLAKLTRLRLPSNRFNSSIPPSWAEGDAFPQLETLNLANNRLAGSLPPAPNGSSLLPSLVFLYLENNTLSSTLPASWGSPSVLPKLEELILFQNQLNGSLPAEWASAGAFKSLKQLDLSDNKLSGPLPGNWGGADAFPALGELRLGGNQLNGTLPDAWSCCGGFPQLYSLSLTSNNLSGTLPASWAPPAFPSLGGLQLDANPGLCGPVPDALYPATCGTLIASTSCVGRQLPACTADFPPASEADVAALLAQSAAISNWAEFAAQNNISGWNAGTTVCQWTGVTCTPQGSIIALELGCDDRGFEGELPKNCIGFAQGALAPELSRISTLQRLVLSNQQLAGTLPPEWGGKGAFANLNELQLGGNQLTGSIQATWTNDGSFPQLLTITLPGNQLIGALPQELGQGGSMPVVTFMDLSSNRLSGSLPVSWASFEFLTYLNLTENSLNGTLPDSWGLDGGMPALTELYISVNRLGGELPTAWGDAPSFAKLGRIELANNSIGGTLPPTYGSNGSFPVIGAMYLDNNQLSGSLPAEWGSPDAFQQLNVMSLEGNRLSGSIPPSWNVTGSFSALTELALDGNPGLCDSAVPALLQPAVCDSQATNCASGQISCQPVAPPSPAPDGNGTVSEAGAGSSTPVGAIVGGVVGGIVLLAAVALLVVGKRRGWLFPSALHKQLSTASRRGGDFSLEEGNVKLVPGMDPGTLSLLPADSDEATLGMLPHSYVSTMGRQVAAAAAHTRATRAAAINGNTSGSPSLHSLESDPVITFISTRLGTLSQRRRSGAPASGEGTSNDTPSGNTPSGNTPSGDATTRPSTNPSSQPTAGSGDTGGTSLTPDMQLWAVRWEQIQLERAIGRGSFGRVYLATWNATPTAVKVLISAEDLEQQQDLELPADIMHDLQEEAIVMSRMRHPNIVSFFGLCTLPPCILTEYCSRGSVFDVLRQASWDAELAGQLTWRLRLSMAYDAARGLLYLHMREPTIVHRDVKSPNLLVDEYWHVKVSDFNLSQILAGQQQPTLDEGGATNPMWLAPEVLSFNAATTASDVYAFGLTMCELLTWRLPFVGLTPFQIRRKVLDGGRPELPPLEQLPGPDNETFAPFDAYCQLMSECWAQDPRRRPAFSEIVARLGAML